MAIRGNSITINYVAWNTSTNTGQTGDAGNHTLRRVKDGTSAAPTNAPSEVDSTNAPGVYSLTLTGTEMTCDCITVCGKSSTANVVIIPLTVTTEHGVLPNVQQGNAGAVLVAGTNTGPMSISGGVTFTGAAASGATPATAGLTLTGGAASTSSGGTAAAGLAATGGAGAASTNGAAAGVTGTAGGTTTVSGSDGVIWTGTGNGNGVTMAHAGTGKDLNAQTTNALQVNATAINAVSTSSVTTINANIGETQPINFTGTGGSALVQCDTRDFLGQAVQLDGNNLPKVDVQDILGTANAGTAGYVGLDWSAIHAPTTTVDLSGTTIKNLDNNPPGTLTAAAIATGVWQDTTAGDFTTSGSIGKSLYTSGNAPGAASGLALVGSNMGTASSVTGSVGSISGVTFPSNFSSLAITGGGAVTVGTNNDKTGYSLSQAFPSNFASLSIDASGRVVLTPAEHTNIAGDVLNATATSYNTAGSIGQKINAAGGAADPLTNAVPGSYAAGTAGYAIGNQLANVDGKTIPAALQVIAAVVAGIITDAGTGTEIFLGLDGLTTRVTVTADAKGNRSAVVYS